MSVMLSNHRMLRSEIDASVNFVWDIDEKQALEARYVRRHKNYAACYLSTQTGCAQACRMCHLTFTGQNKPRDATFEELLEQAQVVMHYYVNNTEPAKTVHYNFMARGEPLASEVLLAGSEDLFLRLGALAKDCKVLPRFLVSTIMPKSLPGSLVQLFPVVHPEFYYSLYSVREDFRRKWLPKAMEPRVALALLAEWQQHTKKIVRIHHALIEGENDSKEDALAIAELVKNAMLRVDYTLVKYNSPSERHGEESSKAYEYSHWLWANTPGSRVKTIDRVGFDVAASCGMFVG